MEIILSRDHAPAILSALDRWFSQMSEVLSKAAVSGAQAQGRTFDTDNNSLGLFSAQSYVQEQDANVQVYIRPFLSLGGCELDA